MNVISPNHFLDLFERLGYEVLNQEYNIVGFRNSFGRVNYFDDLIIVYYKVAGEWIYESFQATTYPGTPSLLNPGNPKGTAILKAGQYLYRKGLHKGKYEALVQASPVIVYRDINKDLVYDKIKEESGFFGINIHKASFGAKIVGPNSAGCQVIKEGFDRFMSLINKHLVFRENKFIYTLVEI